MENNPQEFLHYAQGLPLPRSPQTAQHQNIGQHFHLLVEQLLMALPSEPLLANYPQFAAWVFGLAKAAPEIFADNPAVEKEWMTKRTLAYLGHLLEANYDLVLFSEKKAEIANWSTQRHKPNPQQLENYCSTRLQLYLLVETESYAPEEVHLRYYNLGEAALPDVVELTYDSPKHDQTRSHLNALCVKLESILTAPPDAPNVCVSPSNDNSPVFSLEEVEEIALF